LKKKKYIAYSLLVISVIISTIMYFLFAYPSWIFWLFILLPLVILLLALIVEAAIIVSGFVLSFTSLIFLVLGGSEFNASFRYLMICASFLFLVGSTILLLDSVNGKGKHKHE
jgi:hypothetical protein